MAGAQAAYDDVDGVGELCAEGFLPASALDAQKEIRRDRRAEQSRAGCIEQIAGEIHGAAECDDGADDDENDQLGETDRQSGLQHEPTQRYQWKPIVAAAGQAALAAQLHENAFAIRLIRHQRQPAVDIAAIRGGREKQQIEAFDEQNRRDGGKTVKDINGIELEHGYNGWLGSK